MEEDSSNRVLVTKEQLDRVAEIITADWQKLAIKMGYEQDLVGLQHYT